MKRCVSCSDRHADRVGAPRHGVATVWIIAAFPAMAVLLCLVLETANLWMARVELRNALDAASLSAVKTWGEGGTTVAARTEGQVTAGLNTVTGSTVVLGLNTGGGTNGNGPNTGDTLLGSITGAPGALTFDCNGVPNCGGGIDFGVRTSLTMQVNSICDTVFGTTVGPFNVTSVSYARFPCANGPPELVRIQTFTCP